MCSVDGPIYVDNLFYILAAPEGPPENLTSVRSIHHVKFEWMPPSCPNGIIHRYLLAITTVNKVANIVLLANETTKTVDGFEPYEVYSVEVVASTIVNGNFSDGPPAVLVELTLPDSELSSQQYKHALHFNFMTTCRS